jgi:hypothetical protein
LGLLELKKGGEEEIEGGKKRTLNGQAIGT